MISAPTTLTLTFAPIVLAYEVVFKTCNKLTYKCRFLGTDDVEFEMGGEGPLANGVDPVPPAKFTSFSSVVKEVSLGRYASSSASQECPFIWRMVQ